MDRFEESNLELIEALYATTVGEGSISESVSDYLKLQGEPGGAIIHYDSIIGEARGYEAIGVEHDSTALVSEVFDAYVKAHGTLDNPLIAIALADLIDGATLVSDEVIPHEQFRDSVFYQEIFVPLQIRWSLAWMATGRGQTWSTFTSARREEDGPYNKLHRRRATLFRKHLQRVLHLREIICETQESQFVFENCADRLPQGIVLADNNRRITFSNTAARRIFESVPSVAERGGILTVGSTTHERSKFDNWWQLLVRADVSDGATFREFAMDPLWEIEVSRTGQRENEAWRGRRWMITFKLQPDEDDVSAPYIKHRYSLTEMEAQVCVNLCKNGDAVSTAQAMALSPNTVRTHLKNVFRKTGTRNQVELAIKLVGRNQ